MIDNPRPDSKPMKFELLKSSTIVPNLKTKSQFQKWKKNTDDLWEDPNWEEKVNVPNIPDSVLEDVYIHIDV